MIAINSLCRRAAIRRGLVFGMSFVFTRG